MEQPPLEEGTQQAGPTPRLLPQVLVAGLLFLLLLGTLEIASRARDEKAGAAPADVLMKSLADGSFSVRPDAAVVVVGPEAGRLAAVFAAAGWHVDAYENAAAVPPGVEADTVVWTAGADGTARPPFLTDRGSVFGFSRQRDQSLTFLRLQPESPGP